MDWFPPLQAPACMDYFREAYSDEAYMAIAGAIADMLSGTVDFVNANGVVEYITGTSLKNLANNLSELIYVSTNDEMSYYMPGEAPHHLQLHSDIVFNSAYLLSICYSMLEAALNKLAGPSVEIYYVHFIPPTLADVTVTDYADYLKYVIEEERRH